MTRKDYEMIAGIVREGVNRADTNETALGQQAERSALWRFVTNFASEAGRDNPRFDRRKFIRACGFTPL